MKKILKQSLIALVLLLASMPLKAQNAASVVGENECCIWYLQDHALYQLGDEVNVIDIDVEWPEMLSGYALTALQSALSNYVFRVEKNNLRDAMAAMKARFGEPVTSQFKEIPDDHKFCYVDCKLEIISIEPAKYISMRASYKCKPEKLSSQKEESKSELITYDIQNGVVMTAAELLRMGRLQNGYFDEAFIYEVLNNASVDLPQEIEGLQLTDACMMGNNVMLTLVCYSADETVPFFSLIPWDDMSSLLSKNAKAMMRADGSKTGTEQLSLPATTFNGTAIEKAEIQPKLDQEIPSVIAPYLADIQPYDLAQGKTVLTQFVVTDKGVPCDYCVAMTASPSLNRKVVSALRMLPRFSPATVGGNAVTARVMQRVRIQ